jgi:lipoprotein-anchoring transpeptidase ErfK/SrfK
MRHLIQTLTVAIALLGVGLCNSAAAKFEVVQVQLDYPAGSVVIVNNERKLYYITGSGRAIRYGVAVGKPDELWMGRTFVTEKKIDPRWVPVDGSDAIEGGEDENPLGKRALYLDWSLLRIHGTPSRGSIGRAVSNGCVRMLNEDVMDLFERVHLGAPVFAISSREEAGWYRDAKVANREFANPTARANKEAAEKAAKQ